MPNKALQRRRPAVQSDGSRNLQPDGCRRRALPAAVAELSSLGGVTRMKKFQAFIHGKNFAIREEDRPEPHMRGFYTTVYVEAADFPTAELAAIEVLRQDEQLRATTCNDRSDPPILDVEEMQEIESFEGVRLPRTGFAFYEESESSTPAA